MLNSLLPNSLIAANWRKFLTGKAGLRSLQVLKDAAEFGDIADPRRHLQIISRAALLLRLASGSCELMLRGAHVSLKELRFWWQPLGHERGLWSKESVPEDLLELWTDVDLSAGELEGWVPPRGVALADWRDQFGAHISRLGECERIGLWGLGI